MVLRECRRTGVGVVARRCLWWAMVPRCERTKERASDRAVERPWAMTRVRRRMRCCSELLAADATLQERCLLLTLLVRVVECLKQSISYVRPLYSKQPCSTSNKRAMPYHQLLVKTNQRLRVRGVTCVQVGIVQYRTLKHMIVEGRGILNMFMVYWVRRLSIFAHKEVIVLPFSKFYKQPTFGFSGYSSFALHVF